MRIKWIDKITDTKNNGIADYLIVFFVVTIVLILPTILICVEAGWKGLIYPFALFMAGLGGAGAADNMCR